MENMGGRERGVWMGKEEGEQLKEIVGLVGEPSEELAKTVGELRGGENEEERRVKRGKGVFVCLHVIITVG